MKLFLFSILLLCINRAETKEEFVTPVLIKHYTGLIAGKYKILMNLTPDGSNLEGNYRYYTQKSWLGVTGTADGSGTVHLDETDYKKITGTFDGTEKDNVITGTWANAGKTKSLPFQVTSPHKDIAVKFKVSYILDDGWVTTQSIKVYSADGKAMQQALQMPPDLADAVVEAEQPPLTLEDMNFDGYPDLGLAATSHSVNSFSFFWLYNPATKSFEFNNELTNMSNPEVDLQNKVIKTFGKGSAIDYEYIHYSYVNGKYVEVYKGTKEKP